MQVVCSKQAHKHVYVTYDALKNYHRYRRFVFSLGCWPFAVCSITDTAIRIWANSPITAITTETIYHRCDGPNTNALTEDQRKKLNDNIKHYIQGGYMNPSIVDPYANYWSLPNIRRGQSIACSDISMGASWVMQSAPDEHGGQRQFRDWPMEGIDLARPNSIEYAAVLLIKLVRIVRDSFAVNIGHSASVITPLPDLLGLATSKCDYDTAPDRLPKYLKNRKVF